MTEQSLVRQQENAPAVSQIVPLDRENLTFFANMVKAGGLIPQAQGVSPEMAHARVMAKIVEGSGYGFNVMLSQTCFDVIQGQLQLNAKGVGILFRSTGEYDTRIIQHDNNGCKVAVLKFINGAWRQIGTVEFTRDLAQKAGLLTGPNRGNWEKYFMDICFARVITRVAKRFNPGCMVPRVQIGNHFAKQAPPAVAPPATPEPELPQISAGDEAEPGEYQDPAYDESAAPIVAEESDEIDGEVVEIDQKLLEEVAVAMDAIPFKKRPAFIARFTEGGMESATNEQLAAMLAELAKMAAGDGA